MKNLVYLFSILFFAGCSSEKIADCFKSSGAIVQREVGVSPFTKILVWDRTKLFIQQGQEQKVVVESGKNLIENVKVSVVDGQLEIRSEERRVGKECRSRRSV